MIITIENVNRGWITTKQSTGLIPLDHWLTLSDGVMPHPEEIYEVTGGVRMGEAIESVKLIKEA